MNIKKWIDTNFEGDTETARQVLEGGLRFYRAQLNSNFAAEREAARVKIREIEGYIRALEG